MTGAGVNLLQGTFAPRSSLGNRLRQWRLPAALAAALALLFVVSQAATLVAAEPRGEGARRADRRRSSRRRCRASRCVDARAQMQGALGSAGGAGDGLLAAMSALAQAMAQAPAARIEAVSFRGNALELRLTAPTVESLDGIKQGMSRDGIHGRDPVGHAARPGASRAACR